MIRSLTRSVQSTMSGYTNLNLLNFNGSNNSTTFTDATGKTWVRGGNTIISTAQSKFGGSSAYFDSAGDNISTDDLNDYDTGTSDFTIQCWVRPLDVPTSAGAYRVISSKTDVTAAVSVRSWSLSINGNDSGKFRFAFFSGGTIYTVLSTTAPSINTWYHLAVVRHGPNLKMYVNGVLQNTTSIGTASMNTSTWKLIIGSQYSSGFIDGSNTYYGYMDDFQFVKGKARYTTDFTPPTSQLTLL